MNSSPIAEFIAVGALIGLVGLGFICHQQNIQIEALTKLNSEQALKIETIERTLLMSR